VAADQGNVGMIYGG